MARTVTPGTTACSVGDEFEFESFTILDEESGVLGPAGVQVAVFEHLAPPVQHRLAAQTEGGPRPVWPASTPPFDTEFSDMHPDVRVDALHTLAHRFRRAIGRPSGSHP